VAEGVETEQQLSFLKEEHCDMIQGYLFYRPMPETDFSKLLDYVWYGERLEKGIQ
jgi:EAL domain-containing protein (putative c-di-GMP-specific phosphodiesterase class I)